MMLTRYMVRSAVFLALFAVIGTALVAVTYEGTQEKIAAAEQAALERSLHEVIDPAMHDNDLYADVIYVHAPTALGSDENLPVFRARRDGKPVAMVIETVAPDGYSGDIRLLVGILYDGRVSGVRVIQHRETPGLGDPIERRKSDWIVSFNGRSLNDPEEKRWAVKRDGGIFDQFTGATITPRAVVRAVKNALHYYATNRDALFNRPPDTAPH
jgi:electron transport complex protein RnfG